MTLAIERIDHLVLTVADLAATVTFYTDILGMRHQVPKVGPEFVAFGPHKINLHQRGQEFEPKSQTPTPGSGDLCFITARPMAEVVAHLAEKGVGIEVGPVKRLGALGLMMSVYIRDPDRNLIEIAVYDQA